MVRISRCGREDPSSILGSCITFDPERDYLLSYCVWTTAVLQRGISAIFFVFCAVSWRHEREAALLSFFSGFTRRNDHQRHRLIASYGSVRSDFVAV